MSKPNQNQNHDRCCDELTRLLRIMVELQAANNASLVQISGQLDTALCILEHISRNTCTLVNETHMHGHMHTGAKLVGEAMLGLYKASHPEAALAYEQLEQMRCKMHECCPPKNEPPEPPVCVYEPCPRNPPGSGFNTAGFGQAIGPFRVVGAPFQPSGPDDEDHEPNEAPAPDSPVGPFRGFVVPGSGLKVANFSDGPGAGGDADPVVFGEYTNYGDKATPMSTVAADISGAEAGMVVMASGNWYAMYSLDGGASFTAIDPTTIFPNTADGGFCCDQVLQYAPSIDRFIWLMQFQPGSDGNSRLRIASASPQDVINSRATAWTYWDITNGAIGIPALADTTGPLDYPDMSLGDNHLYLSVDGRGGANIGLVVVRIALNEIQAGGTINFWFTHPGDSRSAFGAHITQNTGDEVFWCGTGSPKDNGTLQVFSWKADSTTYFWRDVSLKYNWANGTISSSAPDGNDWLQKLDNFPRFAAIGATRRNANEVWFAWSCAAGDGGHGGFNFPNPHVQVVKIDVKNGYKLLDHFPIWNPDYAFAYPSLATNDRQEVGITLGWGGDTAYAQAAVGILGDFVVWYPEASDRATTRWGDYVTVRRASPQTGMFAGFGYATLKDTSTAGFHFDPWYILFGRQSVVNPGGGGIG